MRLEAIQWLLPARTTWGPVASGENDENLVIIQGDSGLASAYAVNVLAVYNQYSWRYHRELDHTHSTAKMPFVLRKESGKTDTPTVQSQWKRLQDGDTWQDRYFTKRPDQRELAFWLQERVIGRPEKKEQINVNLHLPMMEHWYPGNLH